MPVATVVAGNKVTATWGNSVAAFAAMVDESTHAWSSPFSVGVTVGNGTLNADYAQVGKVVSVHLEFYLGSTSAITSSIGLTLPVAADGLITLNCVLFDNSVGWFQGMILPSSATAVSVGTFATSATYPSYVSLSSTIPFTWITNDGFVVVGSYLAA